MKAQISRSRWNRVPTDYKLTVGKNSPTGLEPGKKMVFGCFVNDHRDEHYRRGCILVEVEVVDDAPHADALLEDLARGGYYLYAAQFANADRPVFIFAEDRTAAWARARRRGLAIALRPLTLAQQRDVIDGRTPHITFDANDVLE